MTIEDHIDRLHRHGLVDMHFDLPMDLYEKRGRTDVLANDFLADMRVGNMGVVGAAIYIEDDYLPEMALRVALAQIAHLEIEVERTPDFAICRSHAEIVAAREAGQIALLITMEGVEPLGVDPDMLCIFHQLGVRSLGLTHARRNLAGDGGVFAPSGSSTQGLAAHGKELVRLCEQLGIIVDLAHLNPAGFDDVLAMTTGPVIIGSLGSHHFPHQPTGLLRHRAQQSACSPWKPHRCAVGRRRLHPARQNRQGNGLVPTHCERNRGAD
jgi:membrane dipeptidase